MRPHSTVVRFHANIRAPSRGIKNRMTSGPDVDKREPDNREPEKRAQAHLSEYMRWDDLFP